MRPRTSILAAAFAAVLVPAGLALAKDAKARLGIVQGSVLDGAAARVRAESKKRGREELRVEVERAATGLALDAWFEDAAGSMSRGGALVPDNGTPGEYRLRIRTDKGGTLPAGAASLAELAGRRVEIRDGSGNVAAEGNVPAAAERKSSGGSSGSSGGSGRGGADDPANHDAGDDHGGGSGSSGSGSGSGSGGGSGRGGRDDGPNHQ